MSDDYVKGLEKTVQDLEETLQKFMQPLKDVPFPVLVKVISGHRILSFDENNQKNVALLETLKSVCNQAMREAHEKGMYKNRANEAGNKIEDFVKKALSKNGFTANTPQTSKGKKQPAGYPDILIERPNGEKIYLECKTYNIKSINSTLRTFYIQASENTKIMHDAMHLMVSFEIETAQRNGSDVFVPVNWKLYSLENLRLQRKPEFNASNRDMYGVNGLPSLADGRI